MQDEENRRRTRAHANAGTVRERSGAECRFGLCTRRVAKDFEEIHVPLEHLLIFGRDRRPAGGADRGKLKKRANSTFHCLARGVAGSSPSASVAAEGDISNPSEEAICINVEATKMKESINAGDHLSLSHKQVRSVTEDSLKGAFEGGLLEEAWDSDITL